MKRLFRDCWPHSSDSLLDIAPRMSSFLNSSKFPCEQTVDAELQAMLDRIGIDQHVVPSRDLDVVKRDRFELLSAYLDGEVTPEERQLVNSWLAHDPTAKCLYNRLLQLRQGLRSLPIDAPCTPEETLSGVFQGLNRRLRLTYMAGAGVIFLGALGLLSGVFSPRHALVQWATHVVSPTGSEESLQVALDQPAFPIPKAPTNSIKGSPLSIDSEL